MSSVIVWIMHKDHTQNHKFTTKKSNQKYKSTNTRPLAQLIELFQLFLGPVYDVPNQGWLDRTVWG